MHISVISGTQSGGVAPHDLTIDTLVNSQSFNPVVLGYVGLSTMSVADFSNTSSFPALTLSAVSAGDTLTNVVIASGNVGADLANFPLCIDLSLLKAAFKTNIAVGGGNLRAYDVADNPLFLDNVLPWNGTVGKIFVKVPSIATAASTQINLKIEGTTQPAVGAAGGRNGVWTDYETVVFGDTLSFTDHSAKCTYTWVGGTQTDISIGAVVDNLFPTGSGLRFRDDGPTTMNGEAINSTTFAGGDLRSLTVSYSAIQTKQSAIDNYGIMSIYNAADFNVRKTAAWRGTDSAGQDSLQVWDSDNSWFKPAAVFIPTITQAFRTTWTYSANTSGTRRQIYNGPDGTIASASYSTHPVGNRVKWGSETSEGGNVKFDFMYVRSGVLSDHWLRAEYKMLTNPSLIYTPQV